MPVEAPAAPPPTVEAAAPRVEASIKPVAEGPKPGEAIAANLGTTGKDVDTSQLMTDLAMGTDTTNTRPSPEGAQANLNADLAGAPSLQEQLDKFNPADVDSAFATELGGDTTTASPTETPTDVAPVTPDVTTPVQPTDAEPPTAPQAVEQPGETEPTGEAAELAQQQKTKEIEAALALGAKLDQHGVTGADRQKIIDLIAQSPDQAQLVEALNLALESIPNSPDAIASAQTQEDQITDQITKLQNQENPTGEDKKKLGLLKRLLMAMKIISYALIAAGLVVATGAVAAPTLVGAKA